MENNKHKQAQAVGETSVPGKMNLWLKALPGRLAGHLYAILFFIVVWALLAFYEPALLFRVNELSAFIYDDLFFAELMSVPAGFLSYIGCWLVQFFYHPVLGATLYVTMLAMVYRLTCKVFDISGKGSLLALLPVIALLASNTQLGYWIFYMKVPGYYYVALTGVLVSLLVAWLVKSSHLYLKPLLVVLWVCVGYPLFGVYAIVSAVVIGLHSLSLAIRERSGKKGVVLSSSVLLLAILSAYVVPGIYYSHYTTVPAEEVYRAGIPFTQMSGEERPDEESKANAIVIADGISGRTGYPADKELRAFKENISSAFTYKAIETAKSSLYGSTNINLPVQNKSYTFTFVAGDGKEYYLNALSGSVKPVLKEGAAAIPASGQFTCLVSKENNKCFHFRTKDGKYLSWGADGGGFTLADYPETYYVMTKMPKDIAVQVKSDAELFGLVNIRALKDVSGNDARLIAVDEKGGFVESESPVMDDVHSSALRIDEVGFAPKPFPLELSDKGFWHNICIYRIPFYLLLFSFVLIALLAMPLPLPGFWVEWTAKFKYLPVVASLLVALAMVGFTVRFWYNDTNFRVENAQNRAMWEGDWATVAELTHETEVPTRQVVMNKNMALLKLGRSGNEMFSYPDGSADIIAPFPVRLAQTGGKMSYFQYGKFNFCYRWCVEDAVEYGWRIEYLKHAVRSMLLSGEYRLAERYVNILKRTKYYAEWAEDMEKFLQNPELMKKEREFAMPLLMTCYNDALDVDESFVEAYLIGNLANRLENMSRVYVEAALSASLTKKDASSFWYFLNIYVNEFKPNTLPRHYQEAVLLFMNLDKGRTVQIPQAFLDRFISVGTKNKFEKFMQEIPKHKGLSESEMAPYFKGDFGNTYFYFYFFVRNIKTN